MPVKSVNPSPLFIERVEQYRQTRRLSSWSAALIELATLGMLARGVIEPREESRVSHVPAWGGDRKSKG